MAELDILREETQKQVRVLTDNMLLLSRLPSSAEPLDDCVQAARSIGASSRSAGLEVSAHLAHAMEVWFIAARQSGTKLRPKQIDMMLRCADMLDRVVKLTRDVEHVVRIVEVSPPVRPWGEVDESDPFASAGIKRVLVVDDSLEMRELESDLLSYRGYSVEVAMDGMDGWNAIRAGYYDLVLTDIDMPLIDGIKLTELIRREASLDSLPVLVVCDDGETSRMCMLESGANYYVLRTRLEDTLASTVEQLIGPGRS